MWRLSIGHVNVTENDCVSSVLKWRGVCLFFHQSFSVFEIRLLSNIALIVRISHKHTRGPIFKMATPAGFEPATPGLEIRCSIQLSYGVKEMSNIEPCYN